MIFYCRAEHDFKKEKFNQWLIKEKLFTENKSLQHLLKWPSMKWSDSANSFFIRGCIEPAYLYK
jgi:hypothetical protein